MSEAEAVVAAPPGAGEAPPRAFASGAEQDRERLRAAPLRARRHPSALAARIETLRGAGPRLAEAASELGVDSLGDLRSARLRPTRRRGLTILEATVADGSGPTKAVWFNQPWLAEQLEPGARVLLHGKLDKSGFKVDAHEIIRDDDGDAPTGLHTTGIVPVHPASARLRAQKIRDWTWQARGLARDAVEPLPASVRARHR